MDSLETKLKNFIEASDRAEEVAIRKTMSVVLALECPHNDAYLLTKLLGTDALKTLMSVYPGKSFQIPSTQEYNKAMLVGFAYIGLEIRGLSWADLKTEFEEYGIEEGEHYDTTTLGRQVSRLSKWMESKKLELVDEVIRGTS